MEQIWRLIDSGRCSASYNMALDEAVATFVRKGDFPPTLRFYGWDRASVSLGFFQKVSGINTGYCMQNNIPVVRRPTGGRAILHERELTYSFSTRTDAGHFSKGLLDSYKKISEAFALAFRNSGINAVTKKNREKGRILAGSPLCFQTSSYGEILVDNRKAVGSAQKRWRDGMLQQGSIPYEINEEAMLSIFDAGKISELSNTMTGIMKILPGLKEDEFKKTISASFEKIFGIRFVLSRPSEGEALLAQALQERKYLREDWTLRR